MEHDEKPFTIPTIHSLTMFRLAGLVRSMINLFESAAVCGKVSTVSKAFVG